MTTTVIDASAALAWLLQSQATAAADEFLAGSEDRSFIAPFVFEWEVRNILLDFLHRDRLRDIDYRRAVAQLVGHGVLTESTIAAVDVEPLARRESLSLFDAAYLSLAVERGAALASRDKNLLEAAARLGVQTWDLR